MLRVIATDYHGPRPRPRVWLLHPDHIASIMHLTGDPEAVHVTMAGAHQPAVIVVEDSKSIARLLSLETPVRVPPTAGADYPRSEDIRQAFGEPHHDHGEPVG
jgi:hypothetical protein